MTTLKQILEEANERVAVAAGKGIGKSMALHAILTVMCLDDKCKKLFDAIIEQELEFRFTSGTPRDNKEADKQAAEVLCQIRDRVNYVSDGIREQMKQ